MNRRAAIFGAVAMLFAVPGELGAARRKRKSGARAPKRAGGTGRAASGASSGAAYANCTAARAAGAAPVRRGDPGYSRKLDRDGDGVGCE
jgi:hypothetical protein